MNEKVDFRRRPRRIPVSRTASGIMLGLVMLAVALIVIQRVSGLPSLGSNDTHAAVQNDPNSRKTFIVEAAAKASPGVVHIDVVATRIISRTQLSDQFFDEFFRGFIPPSMSRVTSIGERSPRSAGDAITRSAKERARSMFGGVASIVGTE